MRDLFGVNLAAKMAALMSMVVAASLLMGTPAEATKDSVCKVGELQQFWTGDTVGSAPSSDATEAYLGTLLTVRNTSRRGQWVAVGYDVYDETSKTKIGDGISFQRYLPAKSTRPLVGSSLLSTRPMDSRYRFKRTYFECRESKSGRELPVQVTWPDPSAPCEYEQPRGTGGCPLLRVVNESPKVLKNLRCADVFALDARGNYLRAWTDCGFDELLPGYGDDITYWHTTFQGASGIKGWLTTWP